jgi:chemotaxis protein methyltransferase CheR
MLLKAMPSTIDIRDIPDQVFERIRRILKCQTGIQLMGYKDGCIKRRLAVRIRATGCSSAEEYADFLRSEKSEPVTLIKTLTIHVSKFFRNPSTFAKIRDEILPSLFSLCIREGREKLEIRSIGCAGGEEPYTLALILRDAFAAEMMQVPVAISGIDIDSEVVRSARRAVYEPESVEEVPSILRKRYFRVRDGRYHLVQEVKDMVAFLHENLLDPATKQPSDLIVCRNVLIYFERDHQEVIVKGFAGALRSGGVLVMGKTETMVGDARGLFRTECAEERIYRKL